MGNTEQQKKQSKTLFRRAYESTRKYVKGALIGAALGVAVAGCSHRSIPVMPDGGPSLDSRPDILQVDSYRPKQDAGVDAQRPDSGLPPVQYSYTVNNLIGDYLDHELLDRGKGLTAYSFNVSETNPNANPFSDGAGGSIGSTETQLNRIDGSMFQPFATATLTDTSAGKTYTEQQDLWVSGDSHYSDLADAVVGKINSLSYTLKFGGFGIPVCTTPANGTHYETCDIGYQTSTHKLAVKFLGEDWIISEMSPPAAALNSETMLVDGGYIVLAKETGTGSDIKKLKLQSGVALDPDNGNNKYWDVILGWKNKGASVSDTQPDHLRTIILHTGYISSVSSGGSNTLAPGDYIPIPSDPAVLTFGNKGLSSASHSNLSFKMESADFNIPYPDGPDGKECIIYPPYIRVQSATPSAFQVQNASSDTVLIAANGAYCGSSDVPYASLFIRQSQGSTKWAKVEYKFPEMEIKFPQAGDGSASWETGGAIIYSMLPGAFDPASKILKTSLLAGASDLDVENESIIFGISEKAGQGVSADSVARSFFLFTYVTGGASGFNRDVLCYCDYQYYFKKDYARYQYAGPVNTGFGFLEQGTTTERGSQFTQMTDTLVELNIAGNLVHSQFEIVKK